MNPVTILASENDYHSLTAENIVGRKILIYGNRERGTTLVAKLLMNMHEQIESLMIIQPEDSQNLGFNPAYISNQIEIDQLEKFNPHQFIIFDTFENILSLNELLTSNLTIIVISSAPYNLYSRFIHLFDSIIFGSENSPDQVKRIYALATNISVHIEYPDFIKLLNTTNGWLMINNIKKYKQSKLPTIQVDSNVLKISQFDFCDICTNPAFFICCSSDTQNRNLLYNLITECRYTDLVVFTQCTGLYEDMTNHIYDNISMLSCVIKNHPNNILIVVDKMTDRWVNERIFHEFLLNGRHRGLSYVIIESFPVGLKPTIRNNFDYLFFNGNFSSSVEKRLYEHYFGIFDTFKDFRTVYETVCSEGYNYIAVNQRSLNPSITSKITYLSVKDVQPTDKFPDLPQLTAIIDATKNRHIMASDIIGRIKTMHRELDQLSTLIDDFINTDVH